MPALVQRLYALYGSRWDFHILLTRLVSLMEESEASRSGELRAQDEKRASDPQWFLSPGTLGAMLYVDLFAGNLKSLRAKIPYLKRRGITYVHLLPLFASPEVHNDGGYAVSSYRDVDPKLGSMVDLEALAADFRHNGIALVLDFVFNHTSDEHAWALAAKAGDPVYRDYYFIFDDEAEARSYDASLREIFPDTRRGSFTRVQEVGGWVWTTFNSFQWDLNYSNPEVFLAMCSEMLALANIGVDVLRLDALAFVWKRKGTTCENLEEAHLLIQAFQLVSSIVCPSLVFKSEAIVHPDEVIKYIGVNECRLSYNPLQMALFWEAVATRDTRLLRHSLARRWSIPEQCGWVNYLRCHDDIGWTFSDEDAAQCGINASDHRRFLNSFYTGRFPGSFARGEAFQYNPANGDCRVCGTMASLAGLEQAFALWSGASGPRDLELAELYGEMAVRRQIMMFMVLLALPGIPLLYMGDESATLNDYSYRDEAGKSADSRWVHRITCDWARSERLEKDACGTVNSDTLTATAWLEILEARVLASLDRGIGIRRSEPAFGGTQIYFPCCADSRVFSFTRGPAVQVLANFTEQSFDYPLGRVVTGINLLTGERFDRIRSVVLDPYAVLWIREDIHV